MTWVYEVYAQKGFTEQKRCDWLGHSSYRCGACTKGYFQVKDEENHAEHCPTCKAKIQVRKQNQWGLA